jgi:NAD binding domain of 6-phosphogluconate dehydrogenase
MSGGLPLNEVHGIGSAAEAGRPVAPQRCCERSGRRGPPGRRPPWSAAGRPAPRREALAADGVKSATSIRDATTGSDVLVLMVATPDQVDGVLFGDDPALFALAPGEGRGDGHGRPRPRPAVGGPARPAARRAGRCCVSGGAARAGQGDLLIMAGGTVQAVDRVRPLLSTRWPAPRPMSATRPGMGRRSSSSPSSSAESTSPPPPKPSPSPKPCSWTPWPRGRSCAAAAPPRSCSTIAEPAWCTAPTRSRTRSTSSSRTWDSSPTPPAPAATRRPSRPR